MSVDPEAILDEGRGRIRDGNGKIGEKVTERVTEKVTKNQSIIIKEISKDKHITAKKLSGVVGISERKIKENIKALKEKGLRKRIGPDRGGYWEITGRR